MSMIWNSPVALAVMTAFFYALATPLIRTGLLAGATASALCVGYAIPLLLAGVFEKPGEVPEFGSGKGWVAAFVVGILLSVGFRLSARAFALPNGHTSIVAAIIGSFPALAVLIAIAFFGEAQKVRVPAVAIGTALTVAGVVIVSLFGTKP